MSLAKKGFVAVALLCVCAMFAGAQPPPGFTVTTDAATGGKLQISANGKVVYPNTHEVIAAELRLSPSGGGVAPSPIIIANYGNGV